MTEQQIKARRLRYLKAAVLYIITFGLIAVFTFSEIDTRISPFAFAFLFSCLYIRVSKIAVCIFALLVSLFVMDGREDLICSVFTCAIFILLVIILPRLKKRFGKRKRWQKFHLEYVTVVASYIIANSLDIFFAFPSAGGVLGTADFEPLYCAVISAAVGAVFLCACIILINTVRTRKARIPWTAEQKICLGVCTAVFALGLSAFETEYFSLHKFVSVFIILTGIAFFGTKGTLVIAVCLGLGQSFVALDLIYVAIYALFAVSAAAFKTRDRILSAAALIVTDIVLGIYFESVWDYGVYDLLPAVAACILALAVPPKLAKYFDFSVLLTGHLVSKNTINKNRAGIYGRLNNLSGVFNEMQNIYKGLIQGSTSPEDSAKMIAAHVCENVCESCPNKAVCRRDAGAAADVDAGMARLAYIGLQRGAVNFLDLPSTVTMKCSRLNNILGTANSLVEQIKIKQKAAVSLDASKVMMSGLLSGVSRLCKTFADDVCASVVFDNEKSEQIKDELLRLGVVASDCLITKNRTDEYSVSILVPRSNSHNKLIETAVSKICGHKMQIDSIDDGDTAGFCIVTVRTAPRFSLTFGVAQVAKDFNPQNGDTFTFLKITGDKTMMALCDGMGAGERAERASVLALSLVENFYKAGFPNEIIMTSVNQLLTITGQEIFSALDIAVFNLADGCVNFIKVGGADGFIKRLREVEIIEAGSLPIGIVEEMTPKITRAVLGAGDMVVLCSDGVGESFGGCVPLANFINNITAPNAQEIADEIIRECLNRTSKIAADDCTVLIARVDER